MMGLIQNMKLMILMVLQSHPFLCNCFKQLLKRLTELLGIYFADENNPLNEYPDEASTDEELESEETNSEEEEEEEDEERASNSSSGEDIDPPFEEEDGFDINKDDFDFTDGDADPDDWRWSYRQIDWT